jgi:hypothetical protein
MKNYLNLIVFLFLFSPFLMGQVGINTDFPQSTLDVNGDLNVSGKLRVEGTDTSPGDPGAKNKALTSNGLDGSVSWNEVKIPVGYEGGLYLTEVEALSDRVGINLEATGFGVYTENEPLTGNWVEIAGLTKIISVTRPLNKVHVQFQTTAQMSNSGSFSFACGIFLNNQLKGTRVDVLRGDSGAYNIFNINASFDNLTSGNHTFKVACRGRTSSETNGRVAIGTSNVPGTLNSDMAQSALNIYVLEDLLN